MRSQPENHPVGERKNKGGTFDRPRRPHSRRRAFPARTAFWLAAGFALTAVILLVHYAQQASGLRRQLEKLRQVAAGTALPENTPGYESVAANANESTREGLHNQE